MAKKIIDNIDAADLIAKHNGGTAAALVRKLVGGEDAKRGSTAPSTGEASTTARAGRPKTTQRKRTTIFIDEALLAALRREKYENGKDTTQVVNEALRRYFGIE